MREDGITRLSWKILVYISFHDYSIGFDMEITEHLILDDLVTIGDELYVAENFFMYNEINDVESLAYVAEELHIVADIDFFAADVEYVTASVDSLVADVDEDLLMKHYI